MSLGRNVFADLVEMQLHRFGIGPWQDECRSSAAFGTNRAKQIGVFIPLIGRQSWAGPLLRPDAHLAVLLANPRFVLEPYLYRSAFR